MKAIRMIGSDWHRVNLIRCCLCLLGWLLDSYGDNNKMEVRGYLGLFVRLDYRRYFRFRPFNLTTLDAKYFWFKYDLGQKFHAPQVRPDRGSNSRPPDHDSIFHVTETPAQTSRQSVTSAASQCRIGKIDTRVVSGERRR